ncbi:MAG TPA: 1-deoxy-D-xylulose-5-phosphate synthase, partial [Steroidobacteraceae bacterium]|nr:1-deoxy-D-xylulose-5-phosphate synthase [Steroidobacteraceae bacterium]
MSARTDDYPLLRHIDTPADLRRLAPAKLPALAGELREFLIRTVSMRGGHFAAGLGTVELAIALHYVFDTPHDKLVWDVGHQAYPHKVLTGRREQLHTIKQAGGLAPFLKRAESAYDCFGAGHSSTSISAALAFAMAARLTDSPCHVVAVIGDGALTAGLAFEALNHAGSLPADMLVVLNDNDMSISENVGALSRYFARALSCRLYTHLRESGKKILRPMPAVWELARRSEQHAKGMVLPGTLFEELGFNYIGPIDGHDLRALVGTLRNLRRMRGPRLLHVVTRKGKGYPPAEADPIKWHGPGPFDPVSGVIYKERSAGPTFTQVFGRWLCDVAERDPRVVGITPAMREGSGLVEFSKRFPERYFDTAIAEQHAVTFAAGLAAEGLRPVVAIYSTFLQRAYDQLIHDVALQRLPVVFAIDRAGLVGGDGATHQGAFDLSYLRCIPNMVVMAPADENECRQMLFTALSHDGPAAVRYPRGTGCGAHVEQEMKALPLGRGEQRREGASGLALLAFGTMLESALRIGERLD